MTQSLSPFSRRATAGTHSLTRLRDEFDDMINSFFGSGNGGEWLPLKFSPALDVAEKENAFEVHLDLPGMNPDDIDIKVQGNVVTVSGQRTEEKQDTKEKKYHYVERRSGSFSRTFTLPTNVNADQVEAAYNQGVLTLTLPKVEEAKAKRINVKSS